ncbi:ROK family protein [Microbacterium sp. YY-01]|uniref:ROK family protein n=1 Tax=Microbacterium sp. YY-01 TaxID=3421634 RepID=UPI003D1722E8
MRELSLSSSASAEHDVVVALDIGGTSIKGALMTASGTLLHHCSAPTPSDDVISTVRGVLSQLTDSARGHGLSVVAAGVVSPGVIDEERGVVEYSTNLGWRDMPLRQHVSEHLSLPVTIGHDVRAAGLAEYRLGAARGARDFVLVALGTGIAGAIFTDGRALRGGTSASGEIGHMPVFPNNDLCVCGQYGCLEIYSSAAGIARRYTARTGQARTAKEIGERYAIDADARAIWDDAIDALGYTLTSLTLVLDSTLFVLAGGLSLAGDSLYSAVHTAIQEKLTWRSAPQVIGSALQADGGILGAGLLGWDAIPTTFTTPDAATQGRSASA